MTDPVILCPHCKRDIPLTETLAQPLLESTRRQFEQERRERDEAFAKRETALRQAEAAIRKSKEEIAAQVDLRLKSEREVLVRDEAKKARDALADEIAKAQGEKTAVEVLLKQRDAKLAEAQKTELDLRRQRQELQEAKEQFDLEKQRAIDAERIKIREAALKDAAEQHRLKEAEKEKVINDLRLKIDELQRKAEQGSQQLQGEVQELDLESTLRTAFPRDTIEPVPKGAHGGDALQRVIGPQGTICGTILWESKRTKSWQDGWLAKLRADQRDARADVAAIMTATLPKCIAPFGELENVWVTNPACVVPVAAVLRQSLIEVARARSAVDGKQTKMELVYNYLTGPHFRQRVEATIEAWESMKNDLEQEKKVLQKHWAKRSAQIESVLMNTVGMYGELQGIAGRSMPQIEKLELPALEAQS